MWIESGTGKVAMVEKVRQEFVVLTVLEDWLGALARRCDFQLAVEFSAARMLFGAEGRIRRRK